MRNEGLVLLPQEREIIDHLPRSWNVLRTYKIVSGCAVEYYSKFGASIEIRLDSDDRVVFCARNYGEPYGEFVNSNPLKRLKIVEDFLINPRG